MQLVSSRRSVATSFVLGGLLIGCATGCGGGSPVSQFRSGTPEEAAGRVLKLYDADNDGKASTDELKASPGLLDGLSRIDSNRDGAIDLAEMTARFAQHDEMSNVVGFQLNVAAQGAPLDGALVTFTPDPAMGEGKQSYSGTSAAGGVFLAGSELSMTGLPTGYYTVQISQPSGGVDFKRGIEVADDTPSPNRLTIDVRDKAPAASRGR